MTALNDFLFNTSGRIVKLELYEISHPSFSKVYRIVRNKRGGCTATIDGTPQAFTFYPLARKRVGTHTDLNFGLQITLGDLGTIIPGEIKRVRAAGTMGTKPKLRFWEFRNDVLTSPLTGPITLEIPEIPGRTREGCQFEARPPSINVNRTGELYLTTRFVTLRGL